MHACHEQNPNHLNLRRKNVIVHVHTNRVILIELKKLGSTMDHKNCKPDKYIHNEEIDHKKEIDSTAYTSIRPGMTTASS